jgi:hypothetical protein
MMSSLKKRIKMTICQHTMHAEVLNRYLKYLPMLKDSAVAVAFMEKGSKPLNEATLVGMIVARNQYNWTLETIPKSPRTVLLDLESFEKIYQEV